LRRFLLDSDGTADDALAIMMAARHPNVEIVAATAVAGCVRVWQAAENVLHALELGGAAGAAVYVGCEKPLVRPHVSFEVIYGRSGLGNHNYGRARQRPDAAHAIDAITSLAKHYRGELEIVCLGPLTNLAAALVRTPKLAEWPKQVTIYGGSAEGGNVTPAAEYNFHADPEAAEIVLDSGLPIVLVGWDQSRAAMVISDGDIHRIRASGTKECRFFMESTRPLADYCRRTLRLRGSDLGAVLATAIAIEPGVATDETRVRVDVEARGEVTRGSVVLDPVGLSRRAANVRLVRAADADRARAMLFDTLRIDGAASVAPPASPADEAASEGPPSDQGPSEGISTEESAPEAAAEGAALAPTGVSAPTSNAGAFEEA